MGYSVQVGHSQAKLVEVEDGYPPLQLFPRRLKQNFSHLGPQLQLVVERFQGLLDMDLEALHFLSRRCWAKAEGALM